MSAARSSCSSWSSWLGAPSSGFWMTRTAGAGKGWVDLLEVFPSEDRLMLDRPRSRICRDGATTRSRRLCRPSCAPAGGSRPCRTAHARRREAASLRRQGRGLAAGLRRGGRLPKGDREAARRFFEARFAPWSARNHRNPLGLFTGYYEPVLHGSRKRNGRYHRAALRPAAGAGDGGPRPFRDGSQGQADRRQGRDGARPLRRTARRSTRAPSPAASSRSSGWTTRWAPSSCRSRARAHPPGGRGRDAGRLRGAERPPLHLDRPRADPRARAEARGAVSMQSIRAWLEAHPDQTRRA